MSIKPIVAALAALSLSGAAFAHGQQLQPSSTPDQARQSAFHAPTTELGRALAGNSYEGYVPHHYLANMHGMWLGGFGQLTGTYNNNYMLVSGSELPAYNVFTTPGTNATVSFPHADVLVGYDSNHAGFLADIGYEQVAIPAATSISLKPAFGVREAYMTYAFNPMFGVKAGTFNSDFGSYDPTAAMQSIVTSVEGLEHVTGVAAVLATNGFHASITGAMLDKGTKLVTGGLTNDAKPNVIILNGGYDMPFKGATVGVQGSYTNKYIVVDATQPSGLKSSGDSAWTVGAHYANDRLTVKGDVLNLRTKDTNSKTPWIWSASGDYTLNPQATAHQMTVGAYGDYLSKSSAIADIAPLHWILGAKFGYAVNKFATADVYVQHAATRNATATNPSNTTAMVALSVKV